MSFIHCLKVLMIGKAVASANPPWLHRWVPIRRIWQVNLSLKNIFANLKYAYILVFGSNSSLNETASFSEYLKCLA